MVLLGPRSIPAIAITVAYFGIGEALATVQFVRMARRRSGLPRARLILAAIATACFGLTIVLAGTASAANGGSGSGSIQPLSRILALIAAFGYLAAFVPPRWLTRLVHRAVAFDLTRSIVTLEDETADPDALWVRLEAAAETILGAPTVVVRGAPAEAVIPVPAHAPARISAPLVRPTGDGGTMVSVPLAAEGEAAVLNARLDGRPLFVDDDLEVVSLLGSLTVQAVAHLRAAERLRETLVDLQQSAAVRASEARFRALLEAHPNAVLAVDEDGLISWCTRSTAEMFGYSEQDIVGQPIDDLVGAPKRMWPRAFADSDGVRHLETSARREDGATFPVEVAISRFELEGRPSQLAVISDVTWRQEADQVRDRFIGVLSHELRTPITSIYGGAQVLSKRAMQLDDETRNELLAGLADESERLQRMIENLLILAKVERGADFFGPRPVLLDRVLADVIERERSLWPTATITLAIRGRIPVVSADEDHLAQIMRNLLANAVKYAGDRASVSVEIEHEAPWVRVVIHDDGPGFEPEDAERIFSLYYRSANGSRAPGAGIGLFVCRQLVEAMGGSMWATSEPGNGATVGFTLADYVEENDFQPDEAVARARDDMASPQREPSPVSFASRTAT